MNPLWALPSVFVLAVVGAYLGGKVDPRVATALDRVALALFGRFVSSHPERERRIEASFLDTTYRSYAAQTYLFALLGLLAGAVAGAYLLAGFLAALDTIVGALAGLPRTMTAPFGIHPGWEHEFDTRTWWTLVLGGGILVGVLTGTLAYALRWQLPASTAAVRRRSIDEGLPRTTAFMFALARGGMEFPAILETLTTHSEVYGETAREFTVASREMNLFGRDMITALRRMSARTPSEQFRTFSENLASVLGSGRDLPGFLEEQYARFREEAEERQEDVLDVLATIAEVYVTVLVAGVLFLLTILLVFGLTTTETLWLLQLLVYLLIPLANAVFAVYLQGKLDQLGISRRGDSIPGGLETTTPLEPHAAGAGRTDGGVTDLRERENRRTLELYDRLERVQRTLTNPIRVLRSNPAAVLWVAIPVALVVFLARVPAAFEGSGVAVRVLDDLLVQSALLVLGSYAVVRELHRRRIDRIEAALPDLLERLASLNEAGMSVVEGFDRVRGSDVGTLTPEVERMWRDVEYGATVDDALVRFGRRVRTTAITRVVTLLTHAMRASGEMGPVLRIAAEQARAEVSLRRKRRRRMFTYLVVIYVSFAVFLVIIVAVSEVLVPSLPESVPLAEGEEIDRLGTSPGAFTRFAHVDQAAYTLVFFHAAMIQAVCAGFLAGQVGEGSLRDGAKHAAVMLGIAYVALVLLTSPVASVSALDTTSDGDAVFVESVSVSDGGFVAVYDGDSLADDDVELLGYSEFLPPGTHENFWIPLQHGEIDDDGSVLLVAHRDTTGTGEFEFRPPYQPGTDQADRPYGSLVDRGTPGVEVEVTYVGDLDRE